MKKIIGLLVSITLAVIAVFGFAGCVNSSASVDPNTYSFVTIDINPSIELVTLGDNVIEVKAANYDACVLLDNEDFSSLTLEQATEKIVSLAEEMGYLTDTNNQVKITVISDDAQAVEILKNTAKTGAEKGSKKAVTNTEPRLQDELTVEKLKEEKPNKVADLTAEKLRLIESVMEYDSAMTYEIGAEMTIKELSDSLKTVIGENKDLFTSQLRSEYSALYSTAKQEIERKIAVVYGEEYLSKWEEYTALETVYNSIISALDKTGLTDDDVVAVSELLGITDLSLIEKGGIVKPEYVKNYIDKHVNKKGSQDSDNCVTAVITILEKYDTENHILTEEEIARIDEAIGSNSGFTLVAEIKSDLSERKAELEEIKNSVSLTADDIAQIKEIEESFSTIKESVLEEMEESISAARTEIAAAKSERLSIS